ncbi:hypothetical protein HAPAU_34340 [Halalkalicoccus paucihalophilus]|uniref:Uncharacterized protein n=1 Tax=Halalkalicoccus paucihalophilus TaxID=1008153 RepID=A0A151A9U2_9EURY|nr:hypothetical protein HAPAU_34340 [Halalkalicoccus paucihalophilus]
MTDKSVKLLHFGTLPAVNDEDSSVGRRAVPSVSEGNYLSRMESTGSCATSRPLKQRAGVFARPRGTWYLLVPHPIPPRPRRPNTVRPPPLDGGRTQVVPSTVPRRRWRGATANGADFCMPSPPRLRRRCRPSRLTGRGTVRIAYESQPRTPRRVCHRWVWNRQYRWEAAPVLPIDTLRDWLELLYDADYTVDFSRLAECTARIPA